MKRFKKKKLINPMNMIYQQWEEDWLDGCEEDKKKEPFFLLFKYDYEYTCKKTAKNKRKNFRMKFYCILPFIIVTLLYITGVGIYNVNEYIQAERNISKFIENTRWDFSIYGTALYVVAVWLTYIVSKWLDVKQYQETWSRYSEHKYAVEMEMFKYVSCMGEYSYKDRKQKFTENIIKTWDENQQKFIKNMKKEKEIKIGDLVKGIKESRD